MAPLQVIPILVRWKIHMFWRPSYGLLYLAKGPGPDFNNDPGDNSNSCRIFPLGLLESDLNNGPSPGHSDLGMLRKIITACTIAALLISLFSRQNVLRRALIELEVFKKNCLTTPHLLRCTHRLTRFHLSSQK